MWYDENIYLVFIQTMKSERANRMEELSQEVSASGKEKLWLWCYVVKKKKKNLVLSLVPGIELLKLLESAE